MTCRGLGVLLAFLCAVAVPVHAHHSAAMFDQGTEISFDGVVTSYVWKNPHVYLMVRTTAADGGVLEQEVEAGASSVLQPLGLRSDSVSAGERVTIRANPNRRGTGIVLGRELVKADGSVLPLYIGSSAVRSGGDERTKSIEGIWFSPREGFFGFNGSRRDWTLTDAGRSALDAFDSHADATHAQCIPVTAPTLMLYPVVTTVTVNEDDETVVFDVDWMASRRVVHMDGRPHPENEPPSLHGHSIGRWEGETLVVDTVDFADHREGTALGIPSGPRKHLVERFTLRDDGRHLEYEVLLEDPDYLAQPVTFSAQWDYRPDLEPSGEPCDLETAQRYLSE